MKQLHRQLIRSLSGVFVLGVSSGFSSEAAVLQIKGIRSLQNGLASSSSQPNLETEGLSSTKIIIRKKEPIRTPQIPASKKEKETQTNDASQSHETSTSQSTQVEEEKIKKPPRMLQIKNKKKKPIPKKIRRNTPVQKEASSPKLIPNETSVSPTDQPPQGEVPFIFPGSEPESAQVLPQGPTPPHLVPLPVPTLVQVVSPSPSLSPTSSKKPERPLFSGFFVGFAGGFGHLYVDGSLYSKSYNVVTDKGSQGIANLWKSARSIYYGSYTENENTWLAEGSIFAGFDAAFFKCLRLGIEVQGAYCGRSMRLAANGVYGSRSKGEGFKDLPGTIAVQGKTGIEEVIFGYTRPKLKTPFHFTITPRIGVPLFSGALLYTKFGIKYENYEIKDTAEENIESTSHQKSGKTTDDVVYNKTRPSFIGGIGLEALVAKGIFVRMEGTCSGGPSIKLGQQELKPAETDRAMEDLEITKMRNFYLGLGAGMRF